MRVFRTHSVWILLVLMMGMLVPVAADSASGNLVEAHLSTGYILPHSSLSAKATPTPESPPGPTNAGVTTLSGDETLLDPPISIQGDLEVGCGWRFEKLVTANIREIRRQEDGSYLLVSDDGEISVSPGSSQIVGQDEWGETLIPIADTSLIRFETAKSVAQTIRKKTWTVVDQCGNTTTLNCAIDAKSMAACLPTDIQLSYGDFSVSVSPVRHLVSLERSEQDPTTFDALLNDGQTLAGTSVSENIELVGVSALGQLAIPLAQLDRLERIDRPEQAAKAEPLWQVTDLSGHTLEATALFYQGGRLASPGLEVTEVDFDKILGAVPTGQGLTLTLPEPFGPVEVVTGTVTSSKTKLPATVAPVSFRIPGEKVSAVARLGAKEPPKSAPVVGKINLDGVGEMPVSKALSLRSISLVGTVVEYEFKTDYLERYGFTSADGEISMPCSASGLCPSGRPYTSEGSTPMQTAREKVWWEYGGAMTLQSPLNQVLGYTPAIPPNPVEFKPTVTITAVGRDEAETTMTFPAKNVQFVQTRRLSPLWCCASPSKYRDSSMDIVGADGANRKVELAALAGFEFDAAYSSSNLAMRLISKRGSAMDAELVKTAPPGHHAFY